MKTRLARFRRSPDKLEQGTECTRNHARPTLLSSKPARRQPGLDYFVERTSRPPFIHVLPMVNAPAAKRKRSVQEPRTISRPFKSARMSASTSELSSDSSKQTLRERWTDLLVDTFVSAKDAIMTAIWKAASTFPGACTRPMSEAAAD